MINLQPIHSKIRAELHRRQKLLNREQISYEGPQTDGTGKKIVDANNIFAKSTWIRMVGLSKGTPAIIGGGLLKQNEEAYYGFEDMYNSPRNTGKDGPNDNKYRPMPGVKSISVEYKNTLATIRTATINWTCWSFDDVTKYTPYFLKPAGSVILEWGHSYSENDITLYDINKKNANMVSDHQEMIENSFNSNGTYDGMVGLVTNFEWSTRDDGGIDCITNISSMGLDILKQRITPVDNINVASTNKNDNPKVELQQNFQSFLAGIESKLKNYEIGSYENGSAVKYPLQWFNTFAAAGKDSNVTTYNRVYISWGWIEDNILNKYLSKIAEGGVVMSSIRSVEPILSDEGKQYTISEAGGLLSPEEIAAAVDGDAPAWQSTEISNHENLISPNYDFFILPGQKHRNAADLTDHPILKDLSPEFQNFKSSRPQHHENLQIGLMRNVLFNWNYLVTNVFNEASDITSALKKLFDRMNENVGIWDLQLVSSPDMPGTLKIVDMNLTKKSVKELIEIPSELNNDYKTVKGGLFYFPVMGKDSIVTAQSLNAKITNEMAMAMIWDNAKENSSPSQMGGIKTVVTSKLGESKDTKDKYLDNVTPGWQHNAFGNKLGFANGKFGKSDGPDIDVNIGDGKKENIDNSDAVSAEIVKRIQNVRFTKDQYDKFTSVTTDDDLIKGSVYATNGKMLSGGVTPWLDVMKFVIAYDTKNSVSIDFDPMTTLEISLTLDGISGIFPGNCFTSNYLPSQYKDRVLFQVFTSTQELDSSSWKTTIGGKMRISVVNQRKITKVNFLDDEEKENQKLVEET